MVTPRLVAQGDGRENFNFCFTWFPFNEAGVTFPRHRRSRISSGRGLCLQRWASAARADTFAEGVKCVLSHGSSRGDGSMHGGALSAARRLPEDGQEISVWQETGVHKPHGGVCEFTLSPVSEARARLRAGGRLPGSGRGTGQPPPPLWGQADAHTLTTWVAGVIPSR